MIKYNVLYDHHDLRNEHFKWNGKYNNSLIYLIRNDKWCIMMDNPSWNFSKRDSDSLIVFFEGYHTTVIQDWIAQNQHYKKIPIKDRFYFFNNITSIDL